MREFLSHSCQSFEGSFIFIPVLVFGFWNSTSLPEYIYPIDDEEHIEYLDNIVSYIILMMSCDILCFKLFITFIENDVLLQIFVITIINGCSRIETKYSEILVYCSHLQIKIREKLLRKELQSVENYIRNSPPVFTAAGFFRLNQGLFSTFCSVIVTYFIIILQFNNENDSPTTQSSRLSISNSTGA